MTIVNKFIFFVLNFMVLIFYLNIPVYLDINSFHFITLFFQFFSFALVFIFSLINVRQIRLPYSFLFIYFILMLVSFCYYIDLPDEYGWQGFHDFYLMFVFLVSLILFFGISLRKQYSVLPIFVYATVIAVIANYLDFFGNGHFFVKPDDFGVRAAGFFVNPNNAAVGILLSMSLSIFVVPMRWRVLYAYFCLSGVLLTFSRGGMMGWALIYLYWVFTGTVGRKMGSMSIFLLVFFSGSILLLFDDISSYVDISLLQSRISFFSGDQITTSIADDSRIRLAGNAFELFTEHPILGNGSFSLLRTGSKQLSHNEYLAMMSDYGVLGLILYLNLIYIVFARKKLFSGVLLITLFWGFFAHDILDSYAFIVAFSLICIYPSIRENVSFRNSSNF